MLLLGKPRKSVERLKPRPRLVQEAGGGAHGHEVHRHQPVETMSGSVGRLDEVSVVVTRQKAVLAVELGVACRVGEAGERAE